MSADNKKLKICPKITEISIVDGNNVMLCWTKVPGADKYAVKRSRKPDGEYEVISWTNKTTFTDMNVEKNKTCWYKVVAVKNLKRKRTSKKTSPIAAEIVSDIPAPTNLETIPSEHGEIKLTWKSPDKKYSFVINRRNDFFDQIIPVGMVDKTRFVDRDIIFGQVYHYSVQSIIKGEAEPTEGNFSPEISCICLDCGEIIEAKKGAFGKVYIQVRIVAGADGYIIERSDDGENFKEVARTKSSVDLRCRDKADRLFATYYYRTRAYKIINGKEFISEGSKAVKVKTR